MLPKNANFRKNNVNDCAFSTDGVQTYILFRKLLVKFYNLLCFIALLAHFESSEKVNEVLQ